MKGIMVGCGQITWPRDTPREQVLADIAQAGYEGAPAGPHYGTPEEAVALLGRYGQKCAPGYLGADFWKAEKAGETLARAREYARFMRAVGCGDLFVAAGGFDGYVTPGGKTRRQLAGHVGPKDGMSDREYRQFATVLNRVGEITLAEGVRSCFHNHVGSVIETRQEIDRLFSLVDRGLVFQGPDTGHLAWAGADVVQFYRDYAASIKATHLKDIDPRVLKEGRAAEWDYRTFSDRGIFTELGEGFVDLPAVFGILKEAGFQGWAIVETDVTQKPSALESATVSRKYLKGIGV